MSVEKEYSWAIAVLLCIVSAAFSNLGTNLQKLAWHRHLLNLPEPEELSIDDNRSHVSYNGFSAVLPVSTPRIRRRQSNLNNLSPSLRTPLRPKSDTTAIEVVEDASTWGFSGLWWFGLCVTGIGALLDFIALGFGAQSIVAPLGSLTLVFNLLFANIIHDETVEKSDFQNTGLILLGCLLAVIFSSKQDTITPVKSLFELFVTPSFTYYAITTLVLISWLQYLLRNIEKNLSQLTSTERTEAEKKERLIYPIISGICGAQSVLFAKLLDELLISTLASKGMFYKRSGTIVVAIALVISMYSQVYFMNEGLRKFSALFIVPIFQSTWIVYSVVGGGLVYEEFHELSVAQIIGFTIGVSLIVIGVYFLSQREVKETKPLTPIAEQNKYGTLSESEKL